MRRDQLSSLNYMNTEADLLFLFSFHYELSVNILGEFFIWCKIF